MDTVVKIDKLVKKYKELTAVNEFSLEIKKGEIFGLLGPNGSGKSTTIGCILGLLKYDSGNIEVFGKPMKSDSYDSKRKIGVIFQNVAVFDELTVYDNIDYFCGLYIKDKETRKKYVEDAIKFSGLEDFTTFLPKKLSGGLLRRLNIACGIAHKPELIILDEPTVAVDPQSRNSILEGIVRLNREGATIIYTSHYMEEVEQICTRIAIMDTGKNLAIGTTEELKNMIKTGETITVEIKNASDGLIEEFGKLPHVIRTEYADDHLKIHYSKGERNVLHLVDFLKKKDLKFGKIYSELPTLNDVFLEMTGKELRDKA